MAQKTIGLLVALALAWATPTDARAFCGFYVAGADDTLVNEATMVVLMREGSQTVLSMQNHYQGPPEGFAMVVPVPEVLQEGDVKVLPEEVFERIDHLAAPRLVEYWERDPCWVEPPPSPNARYAIGGPGDSELGLLSEAVRGRLQVAIEAEFVVGEYEIVILSAEDSGDLDTWLRQNDYAIPEGAEPLLRPYVAAGMKFFVAKVDPTEVTFEDGRAKLSPLRFHYDSETFELPVRLGLLNAEGAQDLIVHILAPGARYEVANYENVTIPTNVDVADAVRDRFAEFYAALFDETLAAHPGSVVTEYAWQSITCDPCPGPPLHQTDALLLGADVMPSMRALGEWPDELRRGEPYYQARAVLRQLVLTRLHTRYDRETLTEDLVFAEATPIAGGREVRSEGGELEHGSMTAPNNNFQGRYAIRHPWEGPIECEHPVRGRWRGPRRRLLVPVLVGFAALVAGAVVLIAGPRWRGDDGLVVELASEVGEAVTAGLRGEPVERRFLGNYSSVDLRGAEGAVELPADARVTLVGLRVDMEGDGGRHYGYALVEPGGEVGWVALDDHTVSTRSGEPEALPDWLEADDALPDEPSAWVRVAERFAVPGCLSTVELPALASLDRHLAFARPACNPVQLRELGGPRYVEGNVIGYLVVFANDAGESVAVGGSLWPRESGARLGIPRPLEDRPPPRAIVKWVDDIR